MPREEQVRWFTWLRYYLDFFWKYGHATRDPETLPLFLQKLASKNKSTDQQAEAERCIALFREVAKNPPPPPGGKNNLTRRTVRIGEELW